MSWSVGHDVRLNRDIGYGVPAFCDAPGCAEVIDRGLSYVCCGAGCGLYFCLEHQVGDHPDYEPTPDHPRWVRHKLAHPSWKEWRGENPEWVEHALRQLAEGGI